MFMNIKESISYLVNLLLKDADLFIKNVCKITFNIIEMQQFCFSLESKLSIKRFRLKKVNRISK